MIETTSIYFEQGGSQHTETTLNIARKRANELGIRDIVVASYTGETGAKATQFFQDCNLVVVAGVVGFRTPNTIVMTTEHRAVIEQHGGRILFSGHAFGMIGRAVKNAFGPMQVDELVANVLRLLSQGVKVACEITCMATDAGLIDADREVIAIGGSGTGADSAVVLKAANTHRLFDLRLREILCKPRG